MEIENLVNNHNDILAHSYLNRIETLQEHSETVQYYYNRLNTINNLDQIIQNITSKIKFGNKYISNESQQMVREMFEKAIYLHDIGKVNPAFQKELNNELDCYINSSETNNTEHSMLSSLLYIDIFNDKILTISNRRDRKFLYFILYVFSYIISRHHTYLEDLFDAKYIHKLNKWYNKVIDNPSYISYYTYKDRLRELDIGKLFNTIRINKHSEFPFYILTKLLYSTLLTCDFYATYSFFENKKPDFIYLNDNDKNKLITSYKNTNILKSINQYKNGTKLLDNDINKIRSDLFLETEKNLLKNLNSHIYYLEAPTGSGKTNMSINLGLNLLKYNTNINKLMYVFPFNTLIEQTKDTLDEVFDSKIREKYRVQVLNSSTPIVANCDENTDYNKELLNKQTLQYPITLTSHVNLFKGLFGTNRDSNLSLVNMCNSVVILDEIQSYKNDRWMEIIKFLSQFAELLNIRFIIMSATLPKLSKLLNKTVNHVDLVTNKDKYFQHDLFKKRVNISYEYLTKERKSEDKFLEDFDEIIHKHGNKKYLIEFINTKTADSIYERLKSKYKNKLILCLTGNDNKDYRKAIIKKIKDESIDDVILVTTQVIEAGVDIDMDIGIKDISLFDSEEQFLGRINRSNKKEGIAYFFNIDNPSFIYKDDLRLEFSILNKEYQEYLIQKNFDTYYKYVFDRLDTYKSEMNDNHINNFLHNVLLLNFKQVEQHMKLIEDNKITLFINYKTEGGETGEKIWREYEELINDRDKSYAQKEIEKTILNNKMDQFTYQYIDNQSRIDKKPKHFDEVVGNIFYIEEGERFMYIDENIGLKRFDSNRYSEESNGLFL